MYFSSAPPPLMPVRTSVADFKLRHYRQFAVDDDDCVAMQTVEAVTD